MKGLTYAEIQTHSLKLSFSCSSLPCLILLALLLCCLDCSLAVCLFLCCSGFSFLNLLDTCLGLSFQFRAHFHLLCALRFASIVERLLSCGSFPSLFVSSCLICSGLGFFHFLHPLLVTSFKASQTLPRCPFLILFGLKLHRKWKRRCEGFHRCRSEVGRIIPVAPTQLLLRPSLLLSFGQAVLCVP